jgi:hypothetical protein
MRLGARASLLFCDDKQQGVDDEEDQHAKAKALAFVEFRRGALAEPQPPPPINMAFTLFAHHAEGGAPSPFYVAIRLPDHSAMITRIVALMVSITLFSRMILSKKSATFWAHAGARPHVRNNPDH